MSFPGRSREYSEHPAEEEGLPVTHLTSHLGCVLKCGSSLLDIQHVYYILEIFDSDMIFHYGHVYHLDVCDPPDVYTRINVETRTNL